MSRFPTEQDIIPEINQSLQQSPASQEIKGVSSPEGVVLLAPFPQDPGPPDYRAYLCSPAELEASYERCCVCGVPPELAKPRHILPQTVLSSRLQANAPLVAVAGRVITPACCADLQGCYIYILCDPELVALKIFAAPEVLVAAEETGVKPGTVFTKASCGTNALGLAREYDHLVAIRGEEHYCRLFKDWWCVASPVEDPAGKTVGFLDISMHAEKELGLAAALLQVMVTSIEREFSMLELHHRRQMLTLPPKMEQQLTSREQKVLQLLLSGLTNEEIAKEFGISTRTVETHQKGIYRKVGVHSLRQLLRMLQGK
ncbi:LuxR C-terminal-related transcriptional regulator [Thermodesulfitimonas sp.]